MPKRSQPARTAKAKAATKPKAKAKASRPPKSALDAEAKHLLGRIQSVLGETEFFTREDCLHIGAFNHVATISRYTHVREALLVLEQHGHLVSLNRTELCLTARAGDYEGGEPLAQRYLPTIKRLALAAAGSFGVMDVVERWRMDQHLTTNAKRVAVRGALRALKRGGAIEALPDYQFRVTTSKEVAA